MKKILRLVFVLAFIAIFVALGTNGTTWASKLNAGNQAPALSVPDNDLAGRKRPDGTGGYKNHPVIPITGGHQFTVGSCATIFIDNAPNGVNYTASVVPENDLAKELPGHLKSCGIKIEAIPSQYLGTKAKVCFPVLLSKNVYGYYWNGAKWMKTTASYDEAKDGRNSCVDIPKDSGNLTFAALFDQ